MMRCLIVGAGAAGISATEAIRKIDPTGEILIYSAEAEGYYYSYTCYICHEHNKNEIKKKHEGVSNLTNCVRCHPDGRKHEDGNGGGGDD